MDELELLARLRRALEASPYSQGDVAKALGIKSSSHVSLMLAGVRPLSLRRLLGIADMVNFDLGVATPQEHRIDEEIGIDMRDTRHPDLLRNIMRKLVKLDGIAQTEHLIRVDAQIDAFISLAEAGGLKKKRA